jgi:sarcosine oxidase
MMRARNRRTTGRTSDCAIIGGGVMGLAAAASLAEGGRTVTLFEADRLAGPTGGSHGLARIIRLTYGQAHYCRLVRGAFEEWDTMARHQGMPLYRRTGSLDIAFAGHDGFAGYQAALTQSDVAFEIMTPTELAARFPQVALPESGVALYQADSAVLQADLCINALHGRALRAGADIRTGVSVSAITQRDDSVTLATPQGAHHAASLVLAAGAYNCSLLRDLGLDLALTFSREQVSFFHPKDRAQHEAARMPLLIFHLGGGVLSSVFPLLRDDPVKIMIENNGRVDLSTEEMDSVKTRDIQRLILPHLPHMTDRLAATDTCHYILTPDGNFVVDRLPARPNIVVCSACSGHGFKFAPVLGHQIAALIADDNARPDPLFAIDPANRPDLVLQHK